MLTWQHASIIFQLCCEHADLCMGWNGAPIVSRPLTAIAAQLIYCSLIMKNLECIPTRAMMVSSGIKPLSQLHTLCVCYGADHGQAPTQLSFPCICWVANTCSIIQLDSESSVHPMPLDADGPYCTVHHWQDSSVPKEADLLHLHGLRISGMQCWRHLFARSDTYKLSSFQCSTVSPHPQKALLLVGEHQRVNMWLLWFLPSRGKMISTVQKSFGT